MVDRLLPAVILVAAGFYLLQAAKLPFGSVARPGAGFYPTAVAVFACLVALIATIQALRAPRVVREVAVADAEAPAQRRRVLSTVVAVVAFCLVMPWVGYPLAACVFGVAALRGLGSRWSAAIVFGVASALVSYFLFAGLLDVPLPRGPW
jgi:putative tricarboxylic transport membrane protein